MADDFTEDFDDEPLPEEFQDEAPPAKVAPPRRPAPAPRARPVVPQRQQVQAPASAPVQTQQVRFVPFELPSRIGIFDNTTGKPLMEETPRDRTELSLIMTKLDILFGAVTELMNKVNELQRDI